MNCDVVVIGAGISGLSCAHDLMQRGCDVRILERQTSTGGNARSVHFDGFLMEQGPSTINVAYPSAINHIRELDLENSARELGPNVRKRYLRDSRGLHGISVHPMGFFLSGYLSLGERLAMATEFLQPRKSDKTEETIHQFASRRFGTGFADKVIDPLAAGIFMGDSKSLSIAGAFPKLVELEQRHGSIIRGILASKRGNEPGRRLLSWDGGIGTLSRTLTKKLGKCITTGTAVLKLAHTNSGFEISTANTGTIRARAVVLAVQPHVAAALLENLDPKSADATGAIAAPPIAVTYLGYHKNQITHELDGLGFLSTKNEGQIISGAQFCSTMFDGRAPADHVAISCYIGGSRSPEITSLPDKELSTLVNQELSGLLGIKGSPVVSRTHHWPRGLPQYTPGHENRRKIIETAHQRIPGLFMTGNFLKGVSIINCLESAKATANLVCTSLEMKDDGVEDESASNMA